MAISYAHAGCQYTTGQVLTEQMNPTTADHVAVIGQHYTVFHPVQVLPAAPQPPPPAQNVTRVRPPQLRLVDGKLEETDWDAFVAEWENFKIAGNLQVGTEKHQLGSVLGETYTRVYNRLGPVAYEALSEQELLDNAKLLIIKRRNKYVHCYKLTHR